MMRTFKQKMRENKNQQLLTNLNFDFVNNELSVREQLAVPYRGGGCGGRVG